VFGYALGKRDEPNAVSTVQRISRLFQGCRRSKQDALSCSACTGVHNRWPSCMLGSECEEQLEGIYHEGVISCIADDIATCPPIRLVRDISFMVLKSSEISFEYFDLARSSSELDDGGEADTDVA